MNSPIVDPVTQVQVDVGSVDDNNALMENFIHVVNWPNGDGFDVSVKYPGVYQVMSISMDEWKAIKRGVKLLKQRGELSGHG